jgi:hypothetical protein
MYDLLFKEQEELALRNRIPILEAPGPAEVLELCLLWRIRPFCGHWSLGMDRGMYAVEVVFQLGVVVDVVAQRCGAASTRWRSDRVAGP